MITPEQLAKDKHELAKYDYITEQWLADLSYDGEVGREAVDMAERLYPALLKAREYLAEIERLQLIEKAAEQLDVLREIKDYIGHYGEQFVLTGNPKDLR